MTRRTNQPSVIEPRRTEIITLKVTADELDEIKRLADRHADGNVSAWVRFAATNFSVRKRSNGKG